MHVFQPEKYTNIKKYSLCLQKVFLSLGCNKLAIIARLSIYMGKIMPVFLTKTNILKWQKEDMNQFGLYQQMN